MTAEKQVDKAYYARPSYATMERFISYQHQIRAVRDLKCGKVLFVGVGDGLVPYYLKTVLGLQVTTYDFDPELNPDVVGDVRSLPFEDGAFDAVVAFEVLEHLPFDEFGGILKEFARISTSHVVLSLPHRSVGFDLVLKFPFVRTLLGRDFVRLLLTVPITFPGFAVSKQHYWEIERRVTKLRDIRAALRKEFRIVKEERAVLDAYRHFFFLEKNVSSLSDSFVRDYYNEHLRKLPTTYTESRWFSTAVGRFDHAQTKKTILRALSHVGTAKRVLEVGPGDGVWTENVLPHASEITLLDQSEEMLARAKANLAPYPNIGFVHSDFLQFIPDRPFDLFFAIRCFEYFEDQERAARQVASLLREGGQAIIITKNSRYISFASGSRKLLHTRMLDRNHIRSLLIGHGLRVTHVYSATLRVRAGNPIARAIFKALHDLHIATEGRFTIPWLFDKLTESYAYVAIKE